MAELNYRESLIKLIRQVCGDPLRGAEIGVHRGATSAALLECFPRLNLLMVDPWKEWRDVTQHTLEEQKRYRREAYERVKFANYRVRVFEMTSEDAASRVTDGEMDFVFIDADHSCEACKQDILLWRPKIRAGGLLCGHDYGKDEFGVTEAVHDVFGESGFSVTDGNIWWYSADCSGKTIAN